MTFVKSPAEQVKQGMIVDQIPWDIDGPKPLGIILSNPCDLEHDKASFLLIAALVPAKETFQASNEFQDRIQGRGNFQLGRKQWDNLCKLIETYIHNKNIVRYYFIDPRPLIEEPMFFVDFQFIISIPFYKSSMLDRVAQLSSPFVEQMITHFAAYTSRIAGERADGSQLEEVISEIAQPYYKTR
jgi:hypothetical protein